jgi:hypothetical protein
MDGPMARPIAGPLRTKPWLTEATIRSMIAA